MTNHHANEWVSMAVFDYANAAKALNAHLTQAGFASRVYEERTLQRWWFLVRPHAGIQVQVPKEQWGKAREFLQIPPGRDAHLQKAIRCPMCQSLRVQYPQMTRKFILPTLLSQAAVFVGLMEKKNYCEDCHHMWKQPGRRTRRVPTAQRKVRAASP